MKFAIYTYIAILYDWNKFVSHVKKMIIIIPKIGFF
jgi:hypothetical protein